MVTYTVHRYKVDESGRIYGQPIPTHVWTKELADAYRGMRFCDSIYENEDGRSTLIWENRR